MPKSSQSVTLEFKINLLHVNFNESHDQNNNFAALAIPFGYLSKALFHTIAGEAMLRTESWKIVIQFVTTVFISMILVEWSADESNF